MGIIDKNFVTTSGFDWHNLAHFPCIIGDDNYFSHWVLLVQRLGRAFSCTIGYYTYPDLEK